VGDGGGEGMESRGMEGGEREKGYMVGGGEVRGGNTVVREGG